jgi:hypothetical protein
LTHAHEVGIAVALMFVAAPIVLGAVPPESIHAQTPGGLAAAWAWTLTLSGLATIWGLFRHRPRMEWAGQLFMGYGLTFYALALVAYTGVNGFLASAIFGVLGLVSWWRSFKISSAPQVQHRLIRESRSASELAHHQRMSPRRRPWGIRKDCSRE